MRFVFDRLLATLSLLLAISVITFALSHAVPGDPAFLIAGENASAETLEKVRQEMGLNRPIPVQYAIYVSNLVGGNLGTSYQSGRPVLVDLIHYAPATLELVVLSVLMTLVLGIVLGVLCALRAGSRFDRLMVIWGSASAALPVFWVGLILQLIFYYWLGLLPGGGRLPVLINLPTVTGSTLIDSVLLGRWDAFVLALRHLILPVVAISLSAMGVTMRVMRHSMLHEMNEPYAVFARSKGLSRGHIVRHHLLRNALNPVIALIGIQFGYAIVGTVLVESVFSWPGLGSYVYGAITNLDYPAIMGVTLFVAVSFVLTNTIVDLCQSWLDPRIGAA